MQRKIENLICGMLVFAENQQEAADICYSAMKDDESGEFGYINRGTHYEVIRI